jgi:hypothetical protein
MADDILTTFSTTLHEFISDLQLVFPEHEVVLGQHRENLKVNADYYISWFEKINEEYFFDISTKNESIFVGGTGKDSKPLEFLPGIDFRKLWNCKITDKTKASIWKYLHILLILVFNYQMKGEKISDTFEEWNKMLDGDNIDEDRLKIMKEQTEKILKLMQNLTSGEEDQDPGETPGNVGSGSTSTSTEQEVPLEEEMKNDPFMKILEGSKIAKLAEELAKEIKFDDVSSDSSVDDIFKKFGKDPKQIMSLVKNVGNKIQNKLSSGDIRQEDLLNEAQTLLSSMKDSKAFKKMFKKAGKHGGKVNPMDIFNTFAKQMGGMGGGGLGKAKTKRSGDEDIDDDDEEEEEGGMGLGMGMEEMMSMMTSMMGSGSGGGGGGAGSASTGRAHSASAVQERLRKKLANKNKK